MAVAMIFSHGTITPRSMTLKRRGCGQASHAL